MAHAQRLGSQSPPAGAAAPQQPHRIEKRGRDGGGGGGGGDGGGASSPSAPAPPRSKKITRASVGGSTGMAPEVLPQFQSWRCIMPSRPHLSSEQLPYVPNPSASAFRTVETLEDEDFYTDPTSCAMDGFNLAVAAPLLSRAVLGVPTGPIDFASQPVMTEIQKRGLQLQKVNTGSKKQPKPPTFKTILGQKDGVFLVEFRWNKPGGGSWHVVAVNCDQRRVFCNTLGVVPFQTSKAKESEATHDEVRRIFHALSTVHVWRVLRKTQRVQAAA